MFGEYFKNLRITKNMTQKQIADAIGKTPMLISGVENGKNGPFSEMDLELISDLLALSKEEKNRLFIEAAKAKRTLPTYLLDYVMEHDGVYCLLEALAQRAMDDVSLTQILRYVKEIE